MLELGEMKVAVTGATGHIGNTLCRALLREGRMVRAMVRKNLKPLEGLNVEHFEGDVINPDSLNQFCQGIHTVFHCAGKISIQGDADGSLHKINVEGTRNVVNACLNNGVSRLVHFSSIHSISPFPHDQVFNENSPQNDETNPYAYNRSKAAGEIEVLKGVAQGLSAVILNPTGVIGPFDFQPSLAGDGFRKMFMGKMPFITEGGFNWVDVRDVATSAIAAEFGGRSGQRYILAGHWESWANLINYVEEYKQASISHFKIPWWIPRLAAPLVEAVAKVTNSNPLFTAESIEALRQFRNISGDKAVFELGHYQRPVRESVFDALTWFKQNNRLQ